MTQPVLHWSGATRSVSVDRERLKRDVVMLSQELGPRDEIAKLEKVADFIRGELVAAHARVSEQEVIVGSRTYRNVIASFGPQNGERIIVGAHYDTAGPYPGADDNASGVAGLLELARLLGTGRLDTRTDLVAYTLEEPPYFRTPLMGSAVHAKYLKDNNVRLRAMISLEMIGYFSDQDGSQGFPTQLIGAFYPSRGNFIAVIGNIGSGLLVRRIKGAMMEGSDLPVYSLNAPSNFAGVDYSDQLNYWNEGFPAVMVTDTSFFRNSNYHSRHDVVETLDFGRMAQVVQGVHSALLDLAQR
jgi:Zn-dependent M28 family amino/carboxypeptidase